MKGGHAGVRFRTHRGVRSGARSTPISRVDAWVDGELLTELGAGGGLGEGLGVNSLASFLHALLLSPLGVDQVARGLWRASRAGGSPALRPGMQAEERRWAPGAGHLGALRACVLLCASPTCAHPGQACASMRKGPELTESSLCDPAPVTPHLMPQFPCL